MKHCFLLVVALLVIGCAQDRGVLPVIPTIIAKGNLIGNGTDQIGKESLVISNTTEWNHMLASIDSVNKKTMVLLEDRIDFSKYTVLAIFDTVWMSGRGSSIDVNIVESYSDIYVEITYDGAELKSLSAIQYRPYLIVKIPKTTKSVRFGTQK
jgi:hypothetical protein